MSSASLSNVRTGSHLALMISLVTAMMEIEYCDGKQHS